MRPTDEELDAAKKHAHEILDHYMEWHNDLKRVRWALNFVGHQRDHHELADITLWLQQHEPTVTPSTEQPLIQALSEIREQLDRIAQILERIYKYGLGS